MLVYPKKITERKKQIKKYKEKLRKIKKTKIQITGTLNWQHNKNFVVVVVMKKLSKHENNFFFVVAKIKLKKKD